MYFFLAVLTTSAKIIFGLDLFNFLNWNQYNNFVILHTQYFSTINLTKGWVVKLLSILALSHQWHYLFSIIYNLWQKKLWERFVVLTTIFPITLDNVKPYCTSLDISALNNFPLTCITLQYIYIYIYISLLGNQKQKQLLCFLCHFYKFSSSFANLICDCECSDLLLLLLLLLFISALHWFLWGEKLCSFFSLSLY